MHPPETPDLSAFRLKRFGVKVESFCDAQNTKHTDVVISTADDHPQRTPHEPSAGSLADTAPKTHETRDERLGGLLIRIFIRTG